MFLWEKKYSYAFVLVLIALSLSGCSLLFLKNEVVPETNTLEALAESLLVKPLENSGASIAISIADINGNIRYSHDEKRLMVPASVQKLFLAADVFYTLPEDFRWKTPIYTTGKVDSNGVLHGDLQITGSWDPTLAGDEPFMDWPWKHLNSWAEILSALGLKHIDGNLVAVSDIYLPGGWEVEDLPQRYAPAVCQLTWNDGQVTTWAGGFNQTEIWEVWPTREWWSEDHRPDRLNYRFDVQSEALKKVFYTPKGDEEDILYPGEDKTRWWSAPDPRLLTLDAFRQALRENGISGGDSSVVTLEQAPRHPDGIGFVHVSPKITQVLSTMLKTSNNGWAEQIGMTVTLQCGKEPNKYPHWLIVLDSLGIDSDGIKGVDVCGMARKNNITAKSLNELLLESYIRWGNEWLELLPEANERNTTLYKRFEDIEGRIVAKTGSLSRCRSLAGYILKDGSPEYVFTIIVNNSPGSPQETIDHFIESFIYFMDTNDPSEL